MAASDELFLRNIDPTLSGGIPKEELEEMPREHQPRPERANGKTGRNPEAEANASPAQFAAENADLRRQLEQAQQRLKDLGRAETQWRIREEEFDRLIEEKAEVIRHLHTQLQEAKIQAELAAPQDVPTENELQQLHDELLREREQLRMDEQELMEQMRNMEIQMSRERAELARQRNELQLLHRELQRELEMASRDATLQAKLAPLYKLQEELGRRSVTESGLRTRSNIQRDASAQQQTVADNPATKETKIIRRSGFFRRMFNREQNG